MRPLMAEALREVLEGRGRRVPLVLAPTGYGKTRASPEILRAVAGKGLARGLVHVAPLRSLVRRIYLDVFSGVEGAGYQMSDPEPEPGKSPYLMRRLVVSTVDSFLWDLFRVPVMEYAKIARGVSDGHYYPAEAAILGSITVMDEAHIYLGGAGDAGAASVLASLAYLSWAGRPVVLETATMHPRLIMEAAQAVRQGSGESRLVVVAWRCVADRLRLHGLRGVDAAVVDEEPGEAVRWRTEYYSGWARAVESILGLAGEGVVLAVANTVGRAAEIYSRLRRVLGERVVLVHGRLASADRREAEDRLARLRRGVVVATQVVEVGVDVNSIAVFTEPAPPENLAQRAGRACRRGASLDWCRENGGLVALVGGPEEAEVYPGDLVEHALRFTAEHRGELDWREPCPRPGITPYLDMVASAPVRSVRARALSGLLRSYLRGDGGPGALLRIMDTLNLCSLFRGSMMIPILTPRGPVTVSLDWLQRHTGVLARCDGAPCIVALRRGEPCGRAPARSLLSVLESPRCSRVAEAVRRDLEAAARGCGEGPVSWALEAGPGQYRAGVGLGV